MTPAFAGAGLFRKPVRTPDQVGGRLFQDHALARRGSASKSPVVHAIQDCSKPRASPRVGHNPCAGLLLRPTKKGRLKPALKSVGGLNRTRNKLGRSGRSPGGWGAEDSDARSGPCPEATAVRIAGYLGGRWAELGHCCESPNGFVILQHFQQSGSRMLRFVWPLPREYYPPAQRRAKHLQ